MNCDVGAGTFADCCSFTKKVFADKHCILEVFGGHGCTVKIDSIERGSEKSFFLSVDTREA